MPLLVAHAAQRGLEDVGEIGGLHAQALAGVNGILDLLVAGLDREGDDDFVDHGAHQHGFQVIQRAEQSPLDDVVGHGVVVGIHDTHQPHVVLAHAIGLAQCSAQGLRSRPTADDQHVSRSPIGNGGPQSANRLPHGDDGGDRDRPEQEHGPHREGSGRTEQHEEQRRQCPQRAGGRYASELLPLGSHPHPLVQA